MLEIDKLSVELNGKSIVQESSFSVPSGKITSMVGESGSGKSMTAAAVLGILPPGGKASGEISFKGDNLLEYSAKDMASIRKTQFFTIFQDAANSFNPSVVMKKQLYEFAGRRMGDTVSYFQEKMEKIFSSISLSPEIMLQYPFQLSGGMLQRCMVACAFYVEPRLLIADEPTSAVDLLVQKELMELLKRLNKTYGTTVLLITHDLDLVIGASQHLVVMHEGRVVESGSAPEVVKNPAHAYTKKLLQTRF